jgi:hypothetical protein
MALPLYGDGCLIPNIPTRLYLVRLAPKCDHKRMQGAVMAVRAESPDDALIYVARNASLGMKVIAVELAPKGAAIAITQ